MKDDYIHTRISADTKARFKDLARRRHISVSQLLEFLITRESFRDMISDHNIEIIQKYGHFIVYLDNEFYCSCDSWPEVTEELDGIQAEIAEIDYINSEGTKQ